MKQIKISVLSIIFLAAAILFLYLWLHNRNKESIYQKKIVKIENRNLKLDSIISVKSDTIIYYKKLIKGADKNLLAYKEKMASLEAHIRTISSKVDTLPFSEDYAFILDNLPLKTDSNKYPLSGNQVKRVHEEKLELLSRRESDILSKEYIYQLTTGITLRDTLINQSEQQTLLLQDKISNYQSLIKTKDKMYSKKKKVDNVLKIGLGVVIVALLFK